jgi:hypothetical protein
MTSRFSIFDNKIKDILNKDSEVKNFQIIQKIFDIENIKNSREESKSFSKYLTRFRKRLTDDYDGIFEATDSLDIDNQNVKHLWVKNKQASLFVKNPNFVESEIVSLNNLRQDLITDLQQYTPKFPKLERIENKDSYLLVIDPADIHIGKLCTAFESGETYDNQVAVQRVLLGVTGILQKVSSFNIDKILFIGGNDILHTDNPKSTTTSGTLQDTDGMWHTNFLIAKQLYVDVLEILLSVADVHFTFNPSNHDYTNGFFLAQVIETYFKDCKNITFDTTIAHRKGFQYYSNLIGTTHGDGAKQMDLPLLMAVEFPVEWSKTKHRYIYTHHVHHKTSKDYAGITIESLRSPSGTDGWHHRNGYQHAPKAVEAFLHCKNNGQIARISHIF